MTLVVAVLSAFLAAGAVLTWPGRSSHASPDQDEAPTCGIAAPVAGTGTHTGDGDRFPRRHRPGRAAFLARGARPGLPGTALDVFLRRLRRPGARAAGRAHAMSEEVQLLDGLAAALEAGLPTEHAVQVALAPVGAGPAAGHWAELAREAREGHPLGAAWQRLARRTCSPTAASVARAWTVASTTGAPVAAAVRSSAHAARERRRLERAVETATAGARATATVLGLLPLAGVGLAALVGVGPTTLYSDPLAMGSAGLGVVLLLTGHLVVRRMVSSVLRGLG
ncbi:type II secretion system F family protein [Ornithinimicrobium pekingense]|uniref:Type II secretion system protein GspF domain-containing protein n=1 Tax=Ornithinimicrobium pekingense TaxID=384677 RepID=A0ABQ2F6U2_9MICO|nr:type II secretion system F family protein [Ornithinimicrobium pekingense]GGK57807.1 hypothetical protein GCM10011509_02780 [Ornithinimicrobium pekingense]